MVVVGMSLSTTNTHKIAKYELNVLREQYDFYTAEKIAKVNWSLKNFSHRISFHTHTHASMASAFIFSVSAKKWQRFKKVNANRETKNNDFSVFKRKEDRYEIETFRKIFNCAFKKVCAVKFVLAHFSLSLYRHHKYMHIIYCLQTILEKK